MKIKMYKNGQYQGIIEKLSFTAAGYNLSTFEIENWKGKFKSHETWGWNNSNYYATIDNDCYDFFL